MLQKRCKGTTNFCSSKSFYDFFAKKHAIKHIFRTASISSRHNTLHICTLVYGAARHSATAGHATHGAIMLHRQMTCT